MQQRIQAFVYWLYALVVLRRWETWVKACEIPDRMAAVNHTFLGFTEHGQLRGRTMVNIGNAPPYDPNRHGQTCKTIFGFDPAPIESQSP